VLRVDPYPSVYALASLGLSLIIVQFSGRIAVYCARYEHPKKTILGASKLLSRLSLFVAQSSANSVKCAGVIVVLQRRFPFDES